MKLKALSIFILILPVFLAGCNVSQNYALQYTFAQTESTKTSFEVIGDAVNLEVPFSDFSCEVGNFKAVLDKKLDQFTLTISGEETEERCSQKFTATISGIEEGEFVMNVIYDKSGAKQQIVSKKFSVIK